MGTQETGFFTEIKGLQLNIMVKKTVSQHPCLSPKIIQSPTQNLKSKIGGLWQKYR